MHDPRIALIKVTSSLFHDGKPVPKSIAHTGVGGQNVSPPLVWEGAPPSAQSFAITLWDPDAPTGGVGFFHWVLFNLPKDARALLLDAGAPTSANLPAGTVQGLTDFGSTGYSGPHPPPGPAHRYEFTVYALDLPRLPNGPTTTGAALRFAIREHVVAHGTLTGLFGI